MRTTGIKDTSTNDIIASLIDLGKTLRSTKVDGQKLSEEKVQAELEKELETWLGKYTIDQRLNPLLGMPGE